MARIRVTALAPGDGERVAALWRELWSLHEGWGGYAASREEAVYARLARRLEARARQHDADPWLGQHVHLVARDEAGLAVGQVEGWVEAHGRTPSAGTTCEVRSLVVGAAARGLGAGRALLEALQALVRSSSARQTSFVAEVLCRNPALGFYTTLGFAPVAHTYSLELTERAVPSPGARAAQPGDAMAVAQLEMIRRAETRRRGDCRLDPPSSLDATFLARVAEHLRRAEGELVLEQHGRLEASGSLWIHTLELPFAPVRRAVLGRLTLARPTLDVAPLIALAAAEARRAGARRLEIADCPPEPADPCAQRLLGLGAMPFSRIVSRLLP